MNFLNDSLESSLNFGQMMRELMENTARNLIIVVVGIYLIFHILATAYQPEKMIGSTWVITLIFVPLSLTAYYLISRWFIISLWIWQFGLAAAISVATLVFQSPEISFLYALLPLLALTTMGWAMGICSTIAVSLFVWLLATWNLVFFPAHYGPLILIAGVILGLVSWTALRPVTTVMHWFFDAYLQSQQNMTEARNHRAQLAKLLKELDQAYYQLERANSALVVARNIAEEAEHFKTEFVTNVSHELRTPLNLIIGFTETMMFSPESYDGVELPGPYRSDMNAAHRSAQHLLALVDDILDLARIEVGKIALARENVNITDLIMESVNIVQDYISAKRLTLEVEIESHTLIAWIDHLRIRQVLLNLLVNAARHTEEGSICISAYQQGGEIVVKVTDTGSGIADEDLNKIFEEFRTTQQPFSEWHSGTGLGLPISKKFVELHQGTIGVESDYGNGTTFWFTLPLRLTTHDKSVYISPDHHHPLIQLGATEGIVVLVHRDPAVVTSMKRYLNTYHVIAVHKWAEALVVSREVKAIAIIVDGEEATSLLPEDLCDIPVIQCTLPNTQQSLRAISVDTMLVKPVTRHELLAAIDRLNRPLNRIMIVDDDPEVVRLFQRMLRVRVPVQNVIEAYNGEEALRLLHEQKPDLVLLDLMMPEVDGHTVLAKMSSTPEWADIPVILVSAHGQDYINLHISSPIQIVRADGFELGEAIQIIDAMLASLAKGWNALQARETTPATTPVV